MERRKYLRNVGLMMGSAFIGNQAIAQMDHSKMPGMNMKAEKKSKKYAVLAKVTSDCVQTTEVCIALCQSMLAKGDPMMAECLKKCLDLVPLCETTGKLANYDSELTPKIAKVCLEACEACAVACKPHIQHHKECKDCYDTCLACVEECKKIKA